ncbi:DUF998 domain-containing protein [Actinotalea sp. K2]|uniref:DUF998 domain-containing protein n=1 Tax=Actinotalea sp. K2 TaxID=2939438 RepID=UPI0020179EED|nr:DUF998 domain-containing protein [Actinotalea sp. K2]MCL3862520.1 DUF998 domain-containing protein [Actinotalea sp. K2]
MDLEEVVVTRIAPEQDRWSRAVALLGAAGPLVFMTVVLLAGLSWAGYDPVRQTHSELGAVGSPVRWVVNLGGFVLLGVTLLAFALAYRSQLRPSAWREVAAVLLVLAGAGMIAVGFTPCDAGCVDVTATGRWHSILSAPGAIGVSSAMIASGPAFRVDGRFSVRWQVASVALGSLTLLSGPLIALELLTGVGGLVQRAAMGVAMLWLCAVGVRLLVVAEEPRRVGAPSRPAA